MKLLRQVQIVKGDKTDFSNWKGTFHSKNQLT